MPPVECEAVIRRYRGVTALDGVSLTLARGEFTALVGPSGSGKTTLLRLLACLDRADEGTVRLDGTEVTGLSGRRRARLRRHRLGIVFQSPPDNLLPYLTVREHLRLGAQLRGVPDEDPQELLAALSLSKRAGHRPAELSGGEQQRVAIAFAAVGRPALLLADEPTGQLDHVAAATVLDAFRALTDLGVTVIAATHDPAVSAAADRVVTMRDGLIE
jgi:putative ABC transport system ATP-binding protein